MAPLNHMPLLFSLFSLILFASAANAICVPRNLTAAAESPFASPSPAPMPSDGHISMAPISQPPESVAPMPSDGHISISQPPESTAPTPSYGHVSAAPVSQPPVSASQAPSNSLPQIPTHADPAIEKICKSTDYPDVCLAAVTPFLNGKTDPESVLGMAIQASIDLTNIAVAKATTIATSAAITPQMASILGDCKDSYNDALDNYKSAMDALGASDVGTVNSMLSAAITDFSDCDDELNGLESPLLAFDGTLTKMTSNCLAIASLIQ
ncbi:pectinesterase inhibitor 10-like [Actinidia eriantha]|uniref:pectinesterase inhibitor 10-like n=1 Tax=Actinidia eriantha TaxID=165200 RepID=UPI0025878E18|nr:pectinesterase inhibitor 10-like [Actinidia eriantha]